jgi:hypothetical protein
LNPQELTFFKVHSINEESAMWHVMFVLWTLFPLPSDRNDLLPKLDVAFPQEKGDHSLQRTGCSAMPGSRAFAKELAKDGLSMQDLPDVTGVPEMQGPFDPSKIFFCGDFTRVKVRTSSKSPSYHFVTGFDIWNGELPLGLDRIADGSPDMVKTLLSLLEFNPTAFTGELAGRMKARNLSATPVVDFIDDQDGATYRPGIRFASYRINPQPVRLKRYAFLGKTWWYEGGVADDTVSQGLKEQLRSEYRNVRLRAAQSLWESGQDEGAVRVVVRMLHDYKPHKVAEDNRFPKISQHLAVSEMASVVTRPAFPVAIGAEEELWEPSLLHESKPQYRLNKTVPYDHSHDNQMHVLALLASIGPSATSGASLLEGMLKDGDLETRVAVAYALWRINGSPEAMVCPQRPEHGPLLVQGTDTCPGTGRLSPVGGG